MLSEFCEDIEFGTDMALCDEASRSTVEARFRSIDASNLSVSAGKSLVG